MNEIKVKQSAWLEEDSRDVETLLNQVVHVSRIVSKIDPSKRCISVSKHGKSVAFDIEMGLVIKEIIGELCKNYARPT
jgi:hypothetical protein